MLHLSLGAITPTSVTDASLTAGRITFAGTAGLLSDSSTLLYDNTNTTGNWVVYSNRLGVSGTLSFSDGTRTVSMETIVTKLSVPIAVGDMIKVTATHKLNGAVTFS